MPTAPPRRAQSSDIHSEIRRLALEPRLVKIASARKEQVGHFPETVLAKLRFGFERCLGCEHGVWMEITRKVSPDEPDVARVLRQELAHRRPRTGRKWALVVAKHLNYDGRILGVIRLERIQRDDGSDDLTGRHL
jgi:hypothetical protein